MSNPADFVTPLKSALAREIHRCIVGIRRRNGQIFRLQKTTPESEGSQSNLCGELRNNTETLVDALDKLTKSDARVAGTPVDPTSSAAEVMEELMKGKNIK